MSKKIAINGFGRIGRMATRVMFERGLLGKEIDLVAVNDIVPAENLAYLLKYDSVQGNMSEQVVAHGEDKVSVDGYEVLTLAKKAHPRELPWKDLGVDLVIESTGLFTEGADAQGHIDAGAKKVILSAPTKTPGLLTTVMGVNDDQYDPNTHHIVSNASCTTNCLAPVVHALIKSGIGIDEGLMSTIHSYTATQPVVDGPSKKDFRGGRAAAINLIPSSTGAAVAVSLAIPEVKGKLTGMSFRVPTPAVSVVDLTFRSSRDTSLAEIKQIMKEASETYLKGVLDYTEELLVSTDFIHNPFSSIFDADASIELNSRFFKLVAWYDNEWGYANRIVDLALKMSKDL